jgi:hypothetical protein
MLKMTATDLDPFIVHKLVIKFLVFDKINY